MKVLLLSFMSNVLRLLLVAFLTDCFGFFVFNQRLIDRKMARNSKVAKSSPPQEMCDIVFCQFPSGEMKGLFSLPNFNDKKKVVFI